jgi:hypothetical protein
MPLSYDAAAESPLEAKSRVVRLSLHRQLLASRYEKSIDHLGAARPDSFVLNLDQASLTHRQVLVWSRAGEHIERLGYGQNVSIKPNGLAP